MCGLVDRWLAFFHTKMCQVLCYITILEGAPHPFSGGAVLQCSPAKPSLEAPSLYVWPHIGDTSNTMPRLVSHSRGWTGPQAADNTWKCFLQLDRTKHAWPRDCGCLFITQPSSQQLAINIITLNDKRSSHIGGSQLGGPYTHTCSSLWPCC